MTHRSDKTQSLTITSEQYETLADCAPAVADGYLAVDSHHFHVLVKELPGAGSPFAISVTVHAGAPSWLHPGAIARALIGE